MMINATLTITERLGLTAGFETERKKTLRRAESSLKDTAEFDQISCNFPWSDNRLYTTFFNHIYAMPFTNRAPASNLLTPLGAGRALLPGMCNADLFRLRAV